MFRSGCCHSHQVHIGMLDECSFVSERMRDAEFRAVAAAVSCFRLQTATISNFQGSGERDVTVLCPSTCSNDAQSYFAVRHDVSPIKRVWQRWLIARKSYRRLLRRDLCVEREPEWSGLRVEVPTSHIVFTNAHWNQDLRPMRAITHTLIAASPACMLPSELYPSDRTPRHHPSAWAALAGAAQTAL